MRTLHHLSRQALADHYLSIREHSQRLCSQLEIEDYTVQPNAEVSPPKWHLAHTTWFFEELILFRFLPGYVRFNEQFRTLFNSYYKSAGEHWLQAERGYLSRPSVAEVQQYRRHVDDAMVIFLNKEYYGSDIYSLLEIGLHHEQQHQELLLMDIKFILGVNPSRPVNNNTPLPSAEFIPEQWRSFPEGVYEIGYSGDGFSFDNELPQHKTYIHQFSISENLISNGDFLEFIDASAYFEPKHWLSLGWDWLQQNRVRHPLYWYQVNGEWLEFTLHGPVPLDLHAPVSHVSYFEANAYANWRGCRLPTEQEMELYLTQSSQTTTTNALLHPWRCDANEGQLWCWTQSHYSPYPGYKPYQGMLEEYNGKFMCNQFVLRGGCIATPPKHYRPSYRNFYHPHQRWMFSGIRLAKDEQ